MPQAQPRRGAIAVLTAFMLVALLSLTAFLLSLSYIELSRTELQAATDAAARSAVIKLAATQSESAGRTAAVEVASRFRVGGRPFAISPADVTFGNATKPITGRYNFTAHASPLNAARVQGRKTASAAAGTIDLPLGSMIGQSDYATQLPAVAMRLDFDICLVLDRSGSMGWDLSDQRFSYPESRRDRPLVENYFSAPDMTASRWGVLSASVDELLAILQQRDVSAKVGLVTFAGDYQFGRYASVTVSQDSDLTTNFSQVTAAVDAIGQKPVIGATDIAAGLSAAEVLLTTSPAARPRTAQPIVILFSDGIFNQGDDPVALAQTLYAQHGIVIHSVTFGAEAAARQTMDSVAQAAGKGYSLHANNAAQLQESFRFIANSIPVLVTE